MLALTDAGLAHVVLAASRLPTAGARVALLHQLAAVADPTSDERRLAQQRRRSRRWRRRRRERVRVYTLLLTDRAIEGLMAQLVRSGRLSQRTVVDQNCFLTALTQLLEEQGTHWAK